MDPRHRPLVTARHTAAPPWLWPALFGAYVALVFVPWVPRPWQPPCNNAWALVLHDAFVKRLGFGTDVVFTFGPYGFLYFGATPDTYILTVLGWLLISAGFAVAIWKTPAPGNDSPLIKLGASVLMTAVVASVDVVDAQILTLTLYATAAWLLASPCSLYPSLIVGASLGLASLVKFSWLIAIAPCVTAITIFHLTRKRGITVLGLVYLISCLTLWLAAGQPFAGVSTYIRASFEIVGGYAEAMQLDHPWGATNAWLFLAVATGLVGWTGMSLRQKDIGLSLSLAGTSALIMFISFKAGFVRHDHHEVVAMAMLVSMALLTFRTTQRLRISILGTAVAIGLFGFVVRFHSDNPSFQPRLMNAFALGGLGDLASVATGRSSPTECFARDMKVIAAAQPLELPRGTVDLYPWGGIDALYANRLTAQHRPVFESYSAYTVDLARLNRSFLDSRRAPEQLLFAVRSLDQRFPSLDDGLSWPEIVSRYELSDEQCGYLLLSRRPTARRWRMVLESELSLQPDSGIALPDAHAVWMELDLPLTVSGKLLRQIYKPAYLILLVQIHDGTRHTFRLIPGAAAAGFLISPVIPNNPAFKVFLDNPADERLSSLGPKAIAITGSPGFTRHYGFGNAKLRFFLLEFDSDKLSDAAP